MKLSDFAAILEQANLPVTYRAFKTGNAPDLPYLVYYESSPAINAADNTVNHQIKSATVELAFERKIWKNVWKSCGQPTSSFLKFKKKHLSRLKDSMSSLIRSIYTKEE